MEISCIFFIVAVIHLAQSYQLPPDAEKCKFSDGKCLTNLSNFLIKHYGKNEWPEVNISRLDAVNIPDVSVAQDDVKKAIWYQVKAKNLIAYGLENTTITKVKSNWDKKTVDIYGKIPRLAAKLDYSLSTKFISFVFNATGHGTAEVQNFQFIIKNNFVANNGFFKLYKVHVTTQIDRAIFDLTNTHSDNTDLAIVVNQLLNESWQEIWPEVKPIFENLLRENFIQIANNILSSIRYEDLFLPEDTGLDNLK
ncbi:circadian clock-controlled protein daywake-like [Drosophila willistoni]|uniref:circadian clock-controlled protein daywake-like n=1 Tax=Drosophila willistoni TaxID=7260 RepID=UPI000C26D386|nr:circadian clock-controlled protein daywake-like [Drosophila willistoni]